MKVYPIQAFTDNYIWLIEKNADVIVVDPGESAQVLGHLENNNLNLKAILLTHNHEDHTAGVYEILEIFPEIPVYGPHETNEWANRIVNEGASFELLDIQFDVIKTAGHTEGHISYVTKNALFCGDALFSAGCGRVFTGDYQAQFEALQKFKNLPEDILAYPAHEYTETNLKFAQTITPENEKIKQAIAEVTQTRAKNQPTLPTSIKKEKEINLFMQAENVGDFKVLRQARDNF